MVQSINAASDRPHRSNDLQERFNSLWPKLEKQITNIRAMPAGSRPAQRPNEETIAEILDSVRTLKRHDDTTEFRTEKALRLIYRLYRKALGEVPPPLRELRSADTIVNRGEIRSGGGHSATTGNEGETTIVLRESSEQKPS
jgi:hypothetical protein